MEEFKSLSNSEIQVLDKVEVTVVYRRNEKKMRNREKLEKLFKPMLDTKNFTFNRDEANAR